MIPFPIDLGWTVTLRGRMAKFVPCERCPVHYVYFVDRLGRGTVLGVVFPDDHRTKQRAHTKAHADLIQNLFKACEPVPCPGCGHVQGHMIPRARRLYLRWMLRAALYLFPLAPIFFVVAGVTTGIYSKFGSLGALVAAAISWPLTAASALGAVALPAYKFLAARRYDPNLEDVEARKQKGRVLALSREEFDKRYPRPVGGPPPGAITTDAPPLDGRITDRRWFIEWPDNGRGTDADTSRGD